MVAIYGYRSQVKVSKILKKKKKNPTEFLHLAKSSLMKKGQDAEFYHVYL